VFDMTKAAGFDAFDVQGSGGNVTFVHAAAGSTLSLENGNSYVVTLQTADSNGASDSTTLSLGNATSGSETYTKITLEDSQFVGTATVNLVSNVASSSGTNTVAYLDDDNLVTLNLSGTGNVAIGTFDDVSTSVTIGNALVGATAVSLSIATLSDDHLATLTIGGASGTHILELDSASTTLAIVDNAAAAVTIDTLGDTSLTSLTLTNSINTKAGTFAIGGSVAEAGLTTLNLNGNVGITIGGDTVTGGVTVAGSTDNATVSFTATGATAKVDSITLGNGAGDTVSLGAGVSGSTQTIVLGNGAGDSISTISVGTVNATVGSTTSGVDSITADDAATVHITAGNGANTISAAVATSTTITVGTGANIITVGAGATGTITVGTHLATVADSITLGASGTSLTAIEKIVGLNSAGLDTITFSDAASVVAGAVQEITGSEVRAAGGNTTLLADWIAAATGAPTSGVTTAAHGINWFQFQGNTYLVETAGADTGALTGTDTVVELTGLNYTFAKATASAGVFHLLG
jgi:hypothetical protein